LVHPNPDAVLTEQWQQWSIPLADLVADGLDVTTIRKVSIGIGDPDNPEPGSVGVIYIDDVRVVKTMPDGD
jgi:hypothetical protein